MCSRVRKFQQVSRSGFEITVGAKLVMCVRLARFPEIFGSENRYIICNVPPNEKVLKNQKTTLRHLTVCMENRATLYTLCLSLPFSATTGSYSTFLAKQNAAVAVVCGHVDLLHNQAFVSILTFVEHKWKCREVSGVISRFLNRLLALGFSTSFSDVKTFPYAFINSWKIINASRRVLESDLKPFEVDFSHSLLLLFLSSDDDDEWMGDGVERHNIFPLLGSGRRVCATKIIN